MMWINNYEFGVEYFPERIVVGRKLDKVWYLAMTNPSDGFRKSRPFKSKRALLIGIITLYPQRLILALLNFL